MALKDNLQKLMIRYGNMTISDLSRATRLPQPTLHQLFAGVTLSPRKRTLRVLADYFAITTEQLIGLEPLPDVFPQQVMKQLNLSTTPILGWDDLKNWPDKIHSADYQSLILEKNTSNATFALQMIGSSMEPLFPEGCLLVFDANRVAKDRDCVIVYLHDANQFVFKKIFIDGHSMYCKSINMELHDLPFIQLKPDDRVIAALLEARIQF